MYVCMYEAMPYVRILYRTKHLMEKSFASLTQSLICRENIHAYQEILSFKIVTGTL